MEKRDFIVPALGGDLNGESLKFRGKVKSQCLVGKPGHAAKPVSSGLLDI